MIYPPTLYGPGSPVSRAACVEPPWSNFHESHFQTLPWQPHCWSIHHTLPTATAQLLRTQPFHMCGMLDYGGHNLYRVPAWSELWSQTVHSSPLYTGTAIHRTDSSKGPFKGFFVINIVLYGWNIKCLDTCFKISSYSLLECIMLSKFPLSIFLQF